MDASYGPDLSGLPLLNPPKEWSLSLSPPVEWSLKGDKSLWEEYLPKLDPESVKKQVAGQCREQLYEPQQRELVSQSADLQLQTDSSERTYLSFGDQGTTATVTEWGQNMQISQYLDHGPSSIYAIDHEDTSEPFLMQRRAQDLQNMIENSQGFGPDVLVDRSGNEWSISTSWLRNRWPRIVVQDEGIWEVVSQWYVRNGVVIQSNVCQNHSNDPLSLEWPTNLHIRIRQLDFANDSNYFNRGEELFAEGVGPGGYGFVRIQRLPKVDTGSEQHSQPNAVAAVVGLFVDGRAVTIEDYETKFKYVDVPAKGTLRLAVGYKLVPLIFQDGKENWKSLVLKPGDVDIDQFLLDTAPKDDVLSDQLLSNKEFYVRRYVEHILSVCMIPILEVSEEAVHASVDLAVDRLGVQNTKTNDKPGARLVALTCGDMYGHRICVSASFFAYMFLLDVARSLPESHVVRIRIKDKCFAHLRWVFERARDKDSSYFVRNYYVNGNVMPDSSTLPSNGLTDTPFQILKAYEYWKVFPDSKKEIRQFLEMDDNGMKWVKALDQKSKGDAFVWRHSQRAGLDYFRLDDHFWVWNAIVAISDILDWDKWNKKQSKTSRIDDGQKEKIRLSRKYKPDRVKDEILRRFTTVYDATKQRMLAVTRSARETRFEFHSRDTALFYHIASSDMFTLQEPRWLSTLQVQKNFLVNQESDSYNPLRHGLAILMAQEGISISGPDVIAMRDDAIKALIATMQSNGFFVFPIENIIDKDGNAKHPDYLAHIFFEVPFILLNSRELKHSSTEGGENGKKPLTSDSQPAENSVRNTSVQSGIVPFSDQVDLKNVVDVKEEWLYNRPDFLDWEMPAKEIVFEQISSLKSSKGFPDLQPTTGPRKVYDVLAQCASYPHQSTYEPEGNPNGCQALIDIGKKNIRSQSLLTLVTIPDIWKRLQKRRIAHEAKKRFIWYGNPSLDSALMCYLSSPDSQKPFIRQFFNHHANGVSFFGDQTSRVRNRWVTQFHCSFLQLQSRKPDQEGISARSPILHLLRGTSLGSSKRYAWLSKTSAGFRFEGDFFDRFWTCHHIESYPNEQSNEKFDSEMASASDIGMNEFLSKERLAKIFTHGGDHVWKQRKVLELLLFFRIINKTYRNGSNILKEINTELNFVQWRMDKITQRSSSSIDSFFASRDVLDTRAELFFDLLARWRELDNILEAVDNHLGIILSNIKRWNSREQDRQPEKPRWTNKDERKYRDAINTALHLCQRIEQGLEIHKSQVATLKRMLEKQRSEAQNNYNRDMSERSYRQSVNITYFTYSTVIFLPLGFAASIYSMQAAPPTDVLQHMVICAIVTFVVLIMLIFALPRCLRILKKVKTALCPSRESSLKLSTVVELEKERIQISYSDFMDENTNLWDKFKRVFKKTDERSSRIDV